MINPIAAYIAWLDSRETIATLTAERDASRAERDALLQRLTVAEGNYKFHLGLTCEADKQRKAQAEHGR